ncbi:oplophorus-luciferin 2-monooxygenase non-catalytic subunit-like, partial [Oppia nitens]|uniref:oplophorus-luciferin 2-monooxygenase non-catalytic subunit-like n=1 Tax=Oppia nitens TaxID=1686743 RepID=UPI0023DC26BB
YNIPVHYCGQCPDAQVVAPCLCDSFGINCKSDADIRDVKSLFKQIAANYTDSWGGKQFMDLGLHSTSLEQLPEDCLQGLTFSRISIWDASSLKHIDTNAFRGTVDKVMSVVLWDSPLLDSSNLFDILNQFLNVQQISVGDCNIQSIPDRAFVGLSKLTELVLFGQTIKTIGRQPFSELPVLERLYIFQTSISYIDSNVFVFNDNFTTNDDNKQLPLPPLTLGLFKNGQLGGSCFNQDTFLNVFKHRPVNIDFGGKVYGGIYTDPNQITYLAEVVFQGFLLANPLNIITLYKQQFNCDDCRNYWLHKQQKLLKQLVDLNCANAEQVCLAVLIVVNSGPDANWYVLLCDLCPSDCPDIG